MIQIFFTMPKRKNQDSNESSKNTRTKRLRNDNELIIGNNLSNIPNEIQNKIVEHLNFNDKKNTRLLNTHFRDLIDANFNFNKQIRLKQTIKNFKTFKKLIELLNRWKSLTEIQLNFTYEMNKNDLKLLKNAHIPLSNSIKLNFKQINTNSIEFINVFSDTCTELTINDFLSSPSTKLGQCELNLNKIKSLKIDLLYGKFCKNNLSCPNYLELFKLNKTTLKYVHFKFPGICKNNLKIAFNLIDNTQLDTLVIENLTKFSFYEYKNGCYRYAKTLPETSAKLSTKELQLIRCDAHLFSEYFEYFQLESIENLKIVTLDCASTKRTDEFLRSLMDKLKNIKILNVDGSFLRYDMIHMCHYPFEFPSSLEEFHLNEPIREEKLNSFFRQLIPISSNKCKLRLIHLKMMTDSPLLSISKFVSILGFKYLSLKTLICDHVANGYINRYDIEILSNPDQHVSLKFLIKSKKPIKN